MKNGTSSYVEKTIRGASSEEREKKGDKIAVKNVRRGIYESRREGRIERKSNKNKRYRLQKSTRGRLERKVANYTSFSIDLAPFSTFVDNF